MNYPDPPTPDYLKAQERARDWLDNLDPMAFDGGTKQLMFDAYVAGWLAGRQSESEGDK